MGQDNLQQSGSFVTLFLEKYKEIAFFAVNVLSIKQLSK